jgi:hypothetical protein
MKNFLRIMWHSVSCRYSPLALVKHTNAGRIYECPCGFAVWEAFSCGPR